IKATAEWSAVDVGRHGHLRAGWIVALRTPMHVLVVHPVPTALQRRRSGDGQTPLSSAAVDDGLIEMGDNDDTDAVYATLAQPRTRRGVQGHLRLVARCQRGEARHQRGSHPAGASARGGERLRWP